MRHVYKYCYLLLILLFVSVVPFALQAQTPGLIYKPATSGGVKVLDPNSDGYVSSSRTPAGFNGTRDEGTGISEIPYRPFPALSTELLGDLNTGTSGGHTDLAPPATPFSLPSTGSPIAAFFDGTNLLFRIRIGSSSTASKGYSVLIDSDQTFNGTGRNPGFEYEVLLASNFAVQVISHTSSGSTVIFTGSVDQYSHKAVAASTGGGNTDYFNDMYVPLTAFNGGITATTPLRMSGITITSAQSGITGTVSDVGGVNFQAYNYDAPAAWRALINGFPATSLSTLETSNFPPVAAVAPVVNGPITASSTSISGTSVEAAGSVVTVLRNGAPICGGAGQPTCPTVSASGTWTITGLSSNLLTAGNTITATVAPSGKGASPSSNPVTVITGVCISTPPPVITGLTGGTGNSTRQFTGTTTYSSRQRITVYSIGGTVIGTYDFTPTEPGPTYIWTTPAFSVTENNYYATVTPLNASNAVVGCESRRSNQLCFRNGQNPGINLDNVSITGVTYNNTTASSATSPTWSEVPTNLTAISGTMSATSSSVSVTIVLFINAVEQNEKTNITTSTTTTTPWSITIPAGHLKTGDIVNVRTTRTLTGGGNVSCPNSFSSASNLLTVQETTTAPVITAPRCGLVTTLSGSSSEPAGTIIQFYRGGTAGERNGTLITQGSTSTAITATVTSTGAWTVDLSSATGGGIVAGTFITARAKASGKVRSVNSNAVSSAAGPTGVLVVHPIVEGATTVSGTGPVGAAGAKLTLYIEGTPFPTPVLVASDGTWSASGLSSQELFAGASVTATFTPTDQCESTKANPVIVSCQPPTSTPVVSPAALSVCSGQTAVVTLHSSEAGISYQLLNGSVATGAAVLGTGGIITLVSEPLAANTTLRVRARKISGTLCEGILTGSVDITVKPLPTNTNIVTAANPACAGGSATVSIANTINGYSYQLINEATGATVGTSQNGNAGTLNFSVSSVPKTTTYLFKITNTEQNNNCSALSAQKATVTVNGPDLSLPVSLSPSRICVGGSVTISLTTQSGYTYQLVNGAGTAVGNTFAGTGGQVTRTVSGIDANTSYRVQVITGTGISSSCQPFYQQQVSVTVTAASVSVSAGINRTICGTSVTLQGSDPAPGTGIWRIVRSSNGSAFLEEPESPTTVVNNLTSGTYEFSWTVTSNCSGTPSTQSATVTITVNCPTSYSTQPPKYKNQYRVGDVLAIASDPDGGVGDATLIGNLPYGVTLLKNGNIEVSDPSELQPGTYTFSVSTVDQKGESTPTTLTLRIYGQEPTITPMPVELVYFTATVQSSKVNLQWLTASEKDNMEFVVQRSADGKTFERIGTVAGSGNSSRPVRYSFVDTTPLTGTAYYRLKQVDNNGEFAYSKVVTISAKGIAADMQLQAYPNPFNSELHVTVTAQKNGSTTLQLINMQGRVIHTSHVVLESGLNELMLSLRNVRNGMYVLKLSGNGINGAVKVLKN